MSGFLVACPGNNDEIILWKSNLQLRSKRYVIGYILLEFNVKSDMFK
jgi:hypothetical protein